MKRIALVVVAVVVTLSACTTLLPEAARQYKELRQSMLPAKPDISNDQRLADLGYAAIVDGNLSLAETHLNSALAVNPHNPYALLNLGVVYQSTGRLAKARELYAKVIALNPEAKAIAATRESHVGLRLDAIASNNLERLDAATATVPPPRPGPNDVERALLGRFATLARLQNESLITPAEYAARRQANLGALLPLTSPPASPVVFLPAPHVQQLVLRLRAIARFRDAGGLTPDEYATERNSILDGLMPVMPGDSLYTAMPTESVEDPTVELARLDRLLAARYISDAEHRRERLAVLALASSAREQETREASAEPVASTGPATSTGNVAAEQVAAIAPASAPTSEDDLLPVSRRAVRVGDISAAKPRDSSERALTPPPVRPPQAVRTATAPREAAPAPDSLTSAVPDGDVAAPPTVMATKDNTATATATATDAPPAAGAKVEEDAAGEALANGIGVHISSFRTPERALKDWDALRLAHGDLLNGLGPHIARVDLGSDKGVFYQLRVGPLADRMHARMLCGELKRFKLYCAPTVF